MSETSVGCLVVDERGVRVPSLDGQEVSERGLAGLFAREDGPDGPMEVRA
ncbi:MAG: hypothetical protein RBU30_00540 [Polyangia bacterium]|nr:hypothetical protein [Polyangia bacterium]